MSDIIANLDLDKLVKDFNSGKWHFEPEIEVTKQHLDKDGNNVIDEFELKSISFVRYMEDEI